MMRFTWGKYSLLLSKECYWVLYVFDQEVLTNFSCNDAYEKKGRFL